MSGPLHVGTVVGSLTVTARAMGRRDGRPHAVVDVRCNVCQGAYRGPEEAFREGSHPDCSGPAEGATEAAPVQRAGIGRTDLSGESKANGSTLLERLPNAPGDKHARYRASCPCGEAWDVRLVLWQARPAPTCPTCSMKSASERASGKPRKPRPFTPQPKAVKTFEAGQVVGDWTLSGESVSDPKSRQRKWQCTCSCGREAYVFGASLRNGKSTGCGKCGIDPSLPVGYGGAHARVRKLKGSASSQPCIVCGEPGDDWAYTHSDLFALVAAERKDGPEMPYSTDPDRYESMCREHHRTYDARIAAINAGKIKPMTVADLYAALVGKLPPHDQQHL